MSIKSECLQMDWCNLEWTPWIPFQKPFISIPKVGGVYRIRSHKINYLVYIGQTGRSLQERLRTLGMQINKEKMPFNDPHTAAPSLWTYRVEDGYEYEFSVAPVDLQTPYRQGLEDMLLWQHRITTGKSTLCNYGRFHPRYIKSKSKDSGKRGYKIPNDEPNNPTSGPSHSPLSLKGNPSDDNWMGLNWSDFLSLEKLDTKNLPKNTGLYKIIDDKTNELLYIGETFDLRTRLIYHSRRNFRGYIPIASYYTPLIILPKHQLLELEADLLGAYYYQYKKPPIKQYKSIEK